MKISRDRSGGALLFVFFATYGWLTQDIQLLAAQQGSVFTARSLPYFITVLGIVGAAWLLAVPPGAAPVRLGKLRWLHFAGFLALMSAYGLMLRPLGFLPATTVFLMLGFGLLGERRVTWLVGVAVMVAAGFWALMSFGLGVFIEPWPSFAAAGAANG